jgi:wobble nucleotide-excising tRNase
MSATPFANLEALADHLRHMLQNEEEPKKFILLYAFNGTGKTRLSMVFKDLGKKGDERDTLYFNAFTEDLFSWDNDLENDEERVLKFNSSSRFFSGLKALELENRIRPFLNRYTDFDFNIDYEQSEVRFFRQVQNGDKPETVNDIKISRGEENLFIWCFFLAILQLTLDGAEAYKWVKYIYIDDPISSLDENNAIAVGHHLAQLLARKDHPIKVIFSSHHSLFFNVLWNELREIDRKQLHGRYSILSPLGTAQRDLRGTQRR